MDKNSKESSKTKLSLEEFPTLASNYWIKQFIEIFEKQGYVHISNEDLKFNQLLTKKNEEYTKDKSDKKRKEIEALKSLYRLFKDNKIYDNHINAKLKILLKVFQDKHSECVVLSNNKKSEWKNVFYDTKLIKIERVSSIEDYVSKLKKQKLFSQDIYYRGQKNINWILKPSIFRDENITEKECEIYKKVLREYPDKFSNEKSIVENLAKMQHFGVPTRLLDFTTSPLIALYFACCEDETQSFGEVIFIKENKEKDIKISDYDSDEISILANMALMENDFSENQIKKLNEKLPVEIRKRCKNSQIKKLIHSSKIVFTSKSNDRIINQHGLFIVVGMGKKKSEPADFSEALIKTIFLISYKQKHRILGDLNILGTTEAEIYPDRLSWRI